MESHTESESGDEYQPSHPPSPPRDFPTLHSQQHIVSPFNENISEESEEDEDVFTGYTFSPRKSLSCEESDTEINDDGDSEESVSKILRGWERCPEREKSKAQEPSVHETSLRCEQ